ncbi:hypothetical protein TNCV_2037071 [Trichonephila clavipes]|nr:hypothetical protein TNCV_2037071 [Trichonephila clavipes]
MGNIRSLISARQIIVEFFFLFQRTRIIAQNARSPTTKAVPRDIRFYKGRNHWIGKGRWVHISNIFSPPIRFQCAPAVAKIVGARNWASLRGTCINVYGLTHHLLTNIDSLGGEDLGVSIILQQLYNVQLRTVRISL